MKMPLLLIRLKIVLKNLLIKKGGCFEYHAVIADKIKYRYVHRASICPALGMDRRSFLCPKPWANTRGGVLFEQACLCRRQAERLPLLLLLGKWQEGLPSGQE